MEEHPLKPYRIKKWDQIHVNGKNLAEDTIPDEWIKCEVEEVQELNMDSSPTDSYHILLSPINGQPDIPGEGFDIEIDIREDDPTIQKLRIIEEPMAPMDKRTDVYDSSANSSTLEHFRFDGRV